ncbi:TetR/AcrR family transcriptional regulator [Cryptosporangium phraense]|uniref:TetR family transcriptional regulator n=1 Tax=Cryptosporangium phraense TaxID=2593070 RepID=A0A545ANX8_9ACTN|nr:TetR/AcrR family transcriptional regulator [Cryptosporangium phraense]TQS42980.1 TetR family transcriptional regulator [Cryptosporangium phraense]
MVNESSRERLIAAAFALFEEQGYEQTTVDDIAARAGVGRTTFFRAFGSKDDVIFPHHESLVLAVRDRLNAAAPDAGVPAIVEGARLVLTHYLDEGDLARARYRLTRTVPALRAREIGGMQQYQRLFREFIVSRGTELFRAELLANAVVTAHNYVLRRWLRELSTDPLAEFDRAMADVLRLFSGSPEGASAVVILRTDQDLDAVLPSIRIALE